MGSRKPFLTSPTLTSVSFRSSQHYSRVSLRYDGDETANQPTSIPAAIPSAQPDDLDPGDTDIITDGNVAYDPAEPVDIQTGDGNGTNGATHGNGGAQWDDGQKNDFGGDEGSHGTGIKEDG